MAALAKGEFLVQATAPERFVGGRPVAGSHEDRGSEEYKQRLRQVLGFAPEAVTLVRYGRLTVAGRRLLEKVVMRCLEAFWIEDTLHTVVKCFLHDVESVGSPMRQVPYSLRGQDQST